MTRICFALKTHTPPARLAFVVGMEMLRERAATSVRGEDWRRVGPIIAFGANATIEMRPGPAF